MGASEWSYFVPYQVDIQQTFERLQQDIFASGKYYKGWNWEPGAVPSSIDELIAWNGEEGTHSILDMKAIADEPAFGVVSPLDEEDLTQVFGTIWPTHAMAEAKMSDLMDLSDSWVGSYLVLFKDQQPDEILFVGFSGD